MLEDKKVKLKVSVDKEKMEEGIKKLEEKVKAFENEINADIKDIVEGYIKIEMIEI